MTDAATATPTTVVAAAAVEATKIYGSGDTQVKALCFSPDRRFLYTANGNTTCYQLRL